MGKPVGAVGAIEPYKDGWHVASSNGQATYFVRLRPRLQCQCGAWMFGHGAPCKHLRAVQARERGEDA
jgi:hypothetical protein